MALADITREAVLAAVAEYDELGQDQFLDKYGFDRARRYVLVHDGKSYDSKPIAGAAHGHLPGLRPLTARQFSGGEATVGRLLRRLGFTVQVGSALTPGALVDRLANPAGSSPAESALAALTEEQRHSLARQYQRLCGRADTHWQNLDDKRAARTTSVPVRYDDARTAVMLRSQGRCENPRCSGDIRDLTDSGDPILEVDSTRHNLKQVLVEQARRRHDELSKS